jgi:hypothetical protein
VNEAWISARAGYGVVVTPSDYFLLEAGNPAVPRECAPGQLNNLQAMATDIVRIEAGAFPFPQAQQTLDAAWRQESALTLLLMALDRQLSPALRSEVAGIASRLLSDQEAQKAVRWRLLGAPLPAVADTEGAPLRGIAAELISEAFANRSRVSAVSDAWERSAFRTQVEGKLASEDYDRLRKVCILHGGFAALVDTLRTGAGKHFSRWLSKTQAEGSILPDTRHIDFLGEWYTEAVGRPLKKKARQLAGTPVRHREFNPTDRLRAYFRRERKTVDWHPAPEQVVAYYELRLPADEAERLRAHLVDCPDCTAQLLELMALEDDPATDHLSSADLDAAWRSWAASSVLPLAGPKSHST